MRSRPKREIRAAGGEALTLVADVLDDASSRAARDALVDARGAASTS